MTTPPTQTSLRKAALIAGLGILIMVAGAPFAEMYVFPKLILQGDAEQTTKNIIANKQLFIAGMFGYLITFICDIIVAWALYIVFKPVNENFSLLTAWFRLVYAVIAIVGLLNIVGIINLLSPSHYLFASRPDQLYLQVILLVRSFKSTFSFGILFFAIHLILLGSLIFKTPYIPTVLGILLIISGIGYLMTALKPFLFPGVNIDFAVYTFYGELIFMLWSLIKGSRIKEHALN